MNNSRRLSRKPTGEAKLPICNHDDKHFRCATLQSKDVKSFHEYFYSLPNKIHQDNFLLTCVKTKAVTHHRVMNGNPCERSSKYFIKNTKDEQIPVCLKTFLRVLDLSRFRLNRITKQYFWDGEIKENRGGFKLTEVFEHKRKAIFEFLEKLNVVEAHYCCDGKLRKYLPTELNISKLYQMFADDTEIDESTRNSIKKSYFHQIFLMNCNFGFGSPRTDECVTCSEFEKRIKAEKDPKNKDNLETERYFHKMRVKAFRTFLEAPTTIQDGADVVDDTLILSFGFQKNLPLLRLPGTALYFKRNIYLYNFTVVHGYSSSSLGHDDVTSYWWTENEYPKNANAIASCLLYHLGRTDLTPYKRIRLVADGCTAPAKNAIVVTALLKWFDEHAPHEIVDVELVFPIRGHAQIPPDSVFTQIEREMKKRKSVLGTDEYVQAIGKFATLRKVGADVPVFDVESAMGDVMKPYSEWMNPKSLVKRIVLRRNGSHIEVKGEEFYTCDSAEFSADYCRVGKSLGDLVFEEWEEKNVISKEKKADLENVLESYFAVDWRILPSLKFFVYLLDVALVSDAQETLVGQQREKSDNEAICWLVEDDSDGDIVGIAS